MKSVMTGLKIGAVAAVTFCLLVPSAFALTLGLPDLNFDSSQGAGANLFGSQGVQYDAATGYLTVSAEALSITYDGVTSTALDDGTVDYRVDLTGAASGGGLVTGIFGTDGVAGDDLIVTDSSGSLLTGDFQSYIVNGIIGTNLAAGQAEFLVTGGSLAALFGGSGGLVHLEFNVSPIFSATTFDNDFSGQIKGDIGRVPEPVSVLLLGSGLLGLGIWGRKKFQG